MKTRLLTIALAALTVGLLGSCSKINERIDGIDQRVGNIENEKIASIENQIASINAAIADLGTIRKDILDLQVAVGDKAVEISELRAADEALGKRIDELKAYVGDLSKYAEKDWASATFATLEQLSATNTELGELKEKVDRLGEAFDGKLSELNTKLTNSINTAISGVKASICALESRVSALEQMIQSVTIVPAYCDGSVESTKDGVLHLDIIVTPAEAVATLTKDSLKVLVNEVKTKAVDVDTVTVTKFKVDAAKGTITARADISSNLPVASGKALTIALYVTNGISSYITEFYPVSLYSNVTVTEETDTTKISIKTDEDFPEPVAGNILVADGFKDSKPTSIEVSGIGTVIFDETATAKIKANAEQAGATSVFFKVEDVTTTKPVENADVVLEVTMKTVDENGIEVFSKGKEAGEVTIEIPVGEDVYCVKNVTLVDENDNPIQGGVVPDSEKIENGKLIFKVNHFSKYAIDYVTIAEYKAVTGVRIESASVTLQVDDTLRLAAVIAPENATNKKVTWSSSNESVATVDNDGKVTAVSKGTTTITVTTVDGSKTATCEVTVTVPVTGVSLNVNTLSLNAGGSYTLIATITPEDATNKNVTWSSSNESVATVDNDGKVTAVSKGAATITVTTVDGSKTATCAVTVIPFVDLGVKTATGKPLYWAECNLGASKPEDPGNYYMWGATALMYSAVDYSKTDGAFTFVTENPYGSNYKNTWDASKGFDFNNVPFADGVFKNNEGERNVFTKYTTIDTYAKSGAPDNITTLQSEDDAATAKNASWRMPTIDDFKSLVANCVLVWTLDYNSTNNAGYIVYKAKNEADKGKVNMGGTWKMWDAANSKYITNTGSEPTGYSTSDIHIFLPAAGYGKNTTLGSNNEAGCYCSSDLNNTNNHSVGAVNFTQSAFNIAYNYFRSYGFSIRPVTEE